MFKTTFFLELHAYYLIIDAQYFIIDALNSHPAKLAKEHKVNCSNNPIILIQDQTMECHNLTRKNWD